MWLTRSASGRNQTDGMAAPTSRQGPLDASEGRTRADERVESCRTSDPPSRWRQAVVFGAGSKAAPVFSIACMITANLRATATAARLKPTFSFSSRPQLLRALSVRVRVRTAAAAS